MYLFSTFLFLRKQNLLLNPKNFFSRVFFLIWTHKSSITFTTTLKEISPYIFEFAVGGGHKETPLKPAKMIQKEIHITYF
jgi:hypothetical protein